ncbi:MAG TPA: hypothetical protein DHW82_08435 [Spirochaetia bacterium]|nr:MAG: hypothetical protein A2Y41_13090 [Spirochaetes bacterium GWB1_36_13]HCL57018.1 hypothetical protein [Spirochaetia bacterium]
MLKKIISLVLFLFLSSCTAVSYLEKAGNLTKKENAPDKTKAYFYGKFYGGGVYDYAILLKNKTTDEEIDIELKEENDFILFQVTPGVYYNDFGYYMWDVIHWYKKGKYNIPEAIFDKDFEIKPGVVYYVGFFTENSFSYQYEQDIKDFKEKYPNFSDWEIQPIYQTQSK